MRCYSSDRACSAAADRLRIIFVLRKICCRKSADVILFIAVINACILGNYEFNECLTLEECRLLAKLYMKSIGSDLLGKSVIACVYASVRKCSGYAENDLVVIAELDLLFLCSGNDRKDIIGFKPCCLAVVFLILNINACKLNGLLVEVGLMFAVLDNGEGIKEVCLSAREAISIVCHNVAADSD